MFTTHFLGKPKKGIALVYKSRDLITGVVPYVEMHVPTYHFPPASQKSNKKQACISALEGTNYSAIMSFL